MKCWNCKIPKLCLENPVGVISSIVPPTQIIQPYFFGESEKKRTCLWLKGLEPLIHNKVDNLFGKQTHVEPVGTYLKKDGTYTFFTDSIAGTSKEASTLRSKTFKSIANEMVLQWF